MNTAYAKIAKKLTVVARNTAEVSLMAQGDGFEYDLDSKARREDIRSLIEIAEDELAKAKKALGELGIKYSE